MALVILRTWGRGGGRRHKVAALGQDRKVAHLQCLKIFLIHQINLAFYPRPALPPWGDGSYNFRCLEFVVSSLFWQCWLNVPRPSWDLKVWPKEILIEELSSIVLINIFSSSDCWSLPKSSMGLNRSISHSHTIRNSIVYISGTLFEPSFSSSSLRSSAKFLVTLVPCTAATSLDLKRLEQRW